MQIFVFIFCAFWSKKNPLYLWCKVKVGKSFQHFSCVSLKDLTWCKSGMDQFQCTCFTCTKFLFEIFTQCKKPWHLVTLLGGYGLWSTWTVEAVSLVQSTNTHYSMGDQGTRHLSKRFPLQFILLWELVNLRKDTFSYYPSDGTRGSLQSTSIGSNKFPGIFGPKQCAFWPILCIFMYYSKLPLNILYGRERVRSSLKEY